jgi:RNase P/RNase MRP subunit p29
MYAGLLIGKEVEILASRDPCLRALKGIVMDETKNLVTVLTIDESIVKIPKRIVTFEICGFQGSEKLIVEGAKIVGTPADRIKG